MTTTPPQEPTEPRMWKPRTFRMFRHRDVTGYSGVGVVAYGVEWWQDGPVVFRWCVGPHPSTVIFDAPGISALLAVHGHDGDTEIQWLDDLPELHELREPDGPDSCDGADRKPAGAGPSSW